MLSSHYGPRAFYGSCPRCKFQFFKQDNEIDEISKQQLATWSSEWERKRIRILSEAEAESEHSQQEARAYAESLLLNSIAEGYKKQRK